MSDEEKEAEALARVCYRSTSCSNVRPNVASHLLTYSRLGLSLGITSQVDDVLLCIPESDCEAEKKREAVFALPKPVE